MTTVELRNLIIEKLQKINDSAFLEEIKTIIESRSGKKIYQTNELQRKKIEKGREQVAKGEVTDNDDVFNEVDSWLKTQ